MLKTAFGKAKWEKYIGDIGEEPPLPPNIHEILDSPCPIWGDKKTGDTHLLVLVPRTVNGKSLTLNRLGRLVKNPKNGGRPTCYEFYCPEGNENAQASQSYWIFKTKDVIPGSRRKSYNQQVSFVRELALKSRYSYEVPHLIEAATAIFMHYVETGERLYTGIPWTYTRCQEQGEGWPMVVGRFAAAGLGVSGDRYASAHIGVGGVWKL